jgi:hypothetical protein
MRMDDVFTVRKTPWLRLPFWVRMAIGGTALLLPLGGGAAAVTALVTRPTTHHARLAHPFPPGAADLPAPPADEPRTGLGRRAEAPAPAAGATDAPRTAPATRGPAARPDDTATAMNPAPAPPGTAAGPVVRTTTMTVTESIPYRTDRVRDPSLPHRTERVVTPGAEGTRELTYEVTNTDGRPTRRKLISSRVVREPVTKIIAIGTARGDSACETGHDDCGRP